VTGGKPNANILQSKSSVSAINPLYFDGSNKYYANPHVIGIGDKAVYVGAIDLFVL
jgi:hypothetical protein